MFMFSDAPCLSPAAVGGAYDFTRAAAANLREKEDWVNNGIGGLFAGATMGLTSTD